MSASPSQNPSASAEIRADQNDGATAGAADHTGEHRQPGTRADSEPPPPGDVLFVNHLSAAGVMEALDAKKLFRVCRDLASRGVGRQIDLLENYYRAEGDQKEAERRRLADRFLLLREDEAAFTTPLTVQIAEVNPELDGLRLERIGGPDGPVVLRWGEHVSAIVDEYDESLETNEIDLRELDERPTVTFRGMVRAANRLLGRAGADQRMIPLLSDEPREVYLGLTKSGALALLGEGLLEEEIESELLEFAGWQR